MRRIYTIGETVMDILFKEQVPVAAKAGGSMLNASVTLGRLKVPVHFISEYGMDTVGEMINSFLTNNGVDTSYIYRYCDGKSALALAFLDENQKASYNFYKIYPQKRLDIPLPPISNGDILMFGSYFGIAQEIRETLLKILTKAKENGAIIIYDPNFRKAHLHELEQLKPFIAENIRIADIIKGSDEDFSNIFNTQTSAEAFDALENPSKILIYTSGNNGVDLCGRNGAIHLPAKQIKPISTVGAGDNFNAGLAYGLFQHNVMPREIVKVSEEIWTRIINCGIDFATEVCLSYENYISKSYAEDYITIK